MCTIYTVWIIMWNLSSWGELTLSQSLNRIERYSLKPNNHHQILSQPIQSVFVKSQQIQIDLKHSMHLFCGWRIINSIISKPLHPLPVVNQPYWHIKRGKISNHKQWFYFSLDGCAIHVFQGWVIEITRIDKLESFCVLLFEYNILITRILYHFYIIEGKCIINKLENIHFPTRQIFTHIFFFCKEFAF